MIEETKPQGYPLRLIMRLLAAKWRRGRDSNPCGVAPKRFSRFLATPDFAAGQRKINDAKTPHIARFSRVFGSNRPQNF